MWLYSADTRRHGHQTASEVGALRQPMTKTYSAAFKERAVPLAVESDQPMAQPARDLGVHENTLHPWLGNYHRAERQEQEGNDTQVSEERQRLRKAKARLKEERAICKKAAASFAPQLPCSPRGCQSSTGAFL
jgi:transposase